MLIFFCGESKKKDISRINGRTNTVDLFSPIIPNINIKNINENIAILFFLLKIKIIIGIVIAGNKKLNCPAPCDIVPIKYASSIPINETFNNENKNCITTTTIKNLLISKKNFLLKLTCCNSIYNINPRINGCKAINTLSKELRKYKPVNKEYIKNIKKGIIIAKLFTHILKYEYDTNTNIVNANITDLSSASPAGNKTKIPPRKENPSITRIR